MRHAEYGSNSQINLPFHFIGHSIHVRCTLLGRMAVRFARDFGYSVILPQTINSSIEMHKMPFNVARRSLARTATRPNRKSRARNSVSVMHICILVGSLSGLVDRESLLFAATPTKTCIAMCCSQTIPLTWIIMNHSEWIVKCSAHCTQDTGPTKSAQMRHFLWISEHECCFITGQENRANELLADRRWPEDFESWISEWRHWLLFIDFDLRPDCCWIHFQEFNFVRWSAEGEYEPTLGGFLFVLVRNLNSNSRQMNVEVWY